MDMMKSAKGSSSQEDEFDGEETEFMVKKESSPVPIGISITPFWLILFVL